MKIPTAHLGLGLGPILCLLLSVIGPIEGMSPEAQSILACTVWIAVWWITEAIPIAATALLPLVLFPLSGGLNLGDTAASYGHKFVFLYAGGFILAIGIERWNLHRRIALGVIQLIGTNIRFIILGFMIATAGLSMWISNTATAVMMLPIAVAVCGQLRDNPQTPENESRRFGKALMIAIAYSASIGGVATLIGTPPNLVLAGVLEEFYGVEITFVKWMLIGFPISVVLLGFCWWYLTTRAYPFRDQAFPGGRAEINRQMKELGPISAEEVRVLIVFLLTALAWLSRSWLLNTWLPNLDDTIIAISAALILFFIPAKQASRALLNWEEAVKLPWGVLLLFGGGLALANGFKATGLAEWIGEQMTLLDGVPMLMLILILVAAVNFLTEITSNLATTAMILPILAPMALTLDVHPYLLLVGTTIAASCAFMLPVATPPNAVVFGSGYLRIPDMFRTGFWLNVVSIVLITLVVYFLLPLLWGFEFEPFPADWIQ
ncbi:MAG: DASS family sodium-coupled anion symporter [Bacteroidota bacterium]